MTEERLEQLEVRIAFQDRTIDELHGTVLALWKELEALKRSVLRAEQKLHEIEADVPARSEPPPPHY